MMVTFARQFDHSGRAAISQSCLCPEVPPAPPASLGRNSRLGIFILDARMWHVFSNASPERRWGSDGASLENASDFSQDPIAADFNLYRYCGDNPLMRTDPSGEAWPIIIVGGGIAGAIDYAVCHCKHVAWEDEYGYREPAGQEVTSQALAKKYSSGYDCNLKVCTKMGTKEGLTYLHPICTREGCVSNSIASKGKAGDCAGFMQLLTVSAHECYHWKAIYGLGDNEKQADSAVILVLTNLKTSLCDKLAAEPNSPCLSAQACKNAVDMQIRGIKSGDL